MQWTLRYWDHFSACLSVMHVYYAWAEDSFKNLLHHLISQGSGSVVKKMARKYMQLLPPRGCYVEGFMRTSRFSASVLLYFENDTR